MVQALKKRMKNEKGFTLIELLAVIVILGIIAAIAIPAIGNVINKSNQKSTVQEGIQIINAAKMYYANHPNMFDTASTVPLDDTALADYLDHVKDTNFTVTVTKSATGKVSYTLAGHGSVKIINPNAVAATTVSEQDLTTFANQ
jgi:type IV pilus assembly protein PilA